MFVVAVFCNDDYGSNYLLDLFESTEAANRFIEEKIESSVINNSMNDMLRNKMDEWKENHPLDSEVENITMRFQGKPKFDQTWQNDKIKMKEHNINVQKWKEEVLEPAQVKKREHDKLFLEAHKKISQQVAKYFGVEQFPFYVKNYKKEDFKIEVREVYK